MESYHSRLLHEKRKQHNVLITVQRSAVITEPSNLIIKLIHACNVTVSSFLCQKLDLWEAIVIFAAD